LRAILNAADVVVSSEERSLPPDLSNVSDVELEEVKGQKSVLLEKRAEATYAEYRRQKSERLRRTRIPTTSLVTASSALLFVQGLSPGALQG
jgi:hypothetical protein